MNEPESTTSSASEIPDENRPPIVAAQSPFLRAPEGARTIFLVTFAAACGPLAAGLFLFGWRAASVAALSIFGCAVIERIYYGVTRVPALLGRSHAWLTGLLLALTLPAFVDWYIPLIAAAFAIIVGKAIFGGVGHFLWQPALVGRLAVTVLFPAELSIPFAQFPSDWPILASNRVLRVEADVRNAGRVENYRRWRRARAAEGYDAILITRPTLLLARLTRGEGPYYGALAFVDLDAAQTKGDLRLPDEYAEDLSTLPEAPLPEAPEAITPPATGPPRPRPAALLQLPPLNDMLYGARPGGIGETSIVIIVVAGLYLVYRNYVKAQLPLAFIASAWCVVAIAPIYLEGPAGTIRELWLPLLTSEGLDVGFTYVNYQLFSCELFLAAFFLSTEMTSRPVTTGGQVIFGIGCGAGAMLLKLYMDVPIPCYMAVLAMNTLTPTIEALWRPRVLGQGFWSRWFAR